MEWFTRIAHALQLSLGMVFLLAVAPKLRAPRAFVRTVGEYRLVPPAMTTAVARGIVTVEAFLALALLSGTLLGLAAPLALATIAVFTGAVAVNLRRARMVPCGCFGAASETISGRSLIRLAMLLLAAVLVAAATTIMTVAPLSVTSLASGDAPVASQVVETVGFSLALVLAGMWVSHLPELWSVIAGSREPSRHREAHQHQHQHREAA